MTDTGLDSMTGPAPTSQAPSAELGERLRRADEALARDDLETANTHMSSAADLCRRLQAAGLGVPATEAGALRELAERCGASLTRIGRDLNAESFRDDQLRRGINSYHATLTR